MTLISQSVILCGMPNLNPSERSVEELLDVIDWYRRCLEDVQDGRVVRGLGEAKLGYDSAMDELRGVLGV